MKFRLILLFVLAGFLGGCASSGEASDDSPPLTPAPTEDDSHGWGANLQGMGGRSN